MSSPSTKTIKKLFALSGNLCAFPKCPTSLVDENSGSVIGEVCHIKGKKPNSPRYDSSQTDEERDAFENLILMCSIHHKVIDDDEESYSVGRLLKIKSNHESRPSVSAQLTTSQQKLEQILENHLRSILEKGSLKKSEELTQKETSYLLKLHKLAKEQEYKAHRSQWLSSSNSLKDVKESINEIFSLLKQNFSSNSNFFSNLNIGFHSEKHLCSIYNPKFISQIEFKGFDENLWSISFSNLCLRIVLFKKRPLLFEQNRFKTEPLEYFNLKPDLNPELKVIWSDKNNGLRNLSALEVCDKCFELLLKYIENESQNPTYDEYGFFKEDNEEVYDLEPDDF